VESVPSDGKNGDQSRDAGKEEPSICSNVNRASGHLLVVREVVSLTSAEGEREGVQHYRSVLEKTHVSEVMKLTK